MGAKGDWVSTEYYDQFRRGGKRHTMNAAEQRLGALQRMHLKTFTEMAMNRFEWFNMPPTVDLRFLEYTLFYNSLALFFEDDNLGFLALRATGSGPINMYDNFTKFRPQGNRFSVFKPLNAEDYYIDGEVDEEGIPQLRKAECVPIWSNYLRTPDLDYAMIYASKLADIDRTIEINAHNSRYTKIVTADEQSRLSMANANKQIDEGQPAIFVNGVFDPQNISAFDVSIPPDVHLNLPILRTRMHADAMSLFGINNSNQDKKERLVADEVAANNDQVAVMRAVNLNARQDACRAIKRIWGLDVWVEYRTDASSADVSSSDDPTAETEDESEADPDGADNTNPE
jgi:hypothetical protein